MSLSGHNVETTVVVCSPIFYCSPIGNWGPIRFLVWLPLDVYLLFRGMRMPLSGHNVEATVCSPIFCCSPIGYWSPIRFLAWFPLGV